MASPLKNDARKIEMAGAKIDKEQADTVCPVCGLPMIVLRGTITRRGVSKDSKGVDMVGVRGDWIEIVHGCVQKGHCEAAYIVAEEELT